MLTFGADAPQVSDLHQHAREHVRLVGSTSASVDLQRFQQRLLQFFHFLWLLQVHSIWEQETMMVDLGAGHIVAETSALL